MAGAMVTPPVTPPAPPISAALIAWLERLFPDRVPPDRTNMDQMHILIGEQKVIRRLRAEQQRQTQNVLETSHVLRG
jgi:hypothetical protein